jgi:16S rRNA processing protein RimM
MAETDPDRLIEIGRLVKLHGVRGELRMLPYNPHSTLATDLPTLLVRTAQGVVRELSVSEARPHKRFLLLRFEGIDDADRAVALVGSEVCVRPEQLPPPGPGEAYHIDLIGCSVETEEGKQLGEVIDIVVTGSNDVCVVHDGDHEVLIPLIDDVIVRMDTDAAKIVIRPLPGLLDA